MKELIGIAALVAALYGGTPVARWIYQKVQHAALEKAATGLPPLTPFARALTGGSSKKQGQPNQQRSPTP